MGVREGEQGCGKGLEGSVHLPVRVEMKGCGLPGQAAMIAPHGCGCMRAMTAQGPSVPRSCLRAGGGGLSPLDRLPPLTHVLGGPSILFP